MRFIKCYFFQYLQVDAEKDDVSHYVVLACIDGQRKKSDTFVPER